MVDRLSIYRIESEDTSVPRQIDLAQRLFEPKHDFELSETSSNRVLRSASHTVEIAAASGGIWAADKAQLWRPSVRPNLPKVEDALAKANELIRQENLLPNLERPFQIGKPIVGGTTFSMRQARKRENRRLDVQVAYPVLVGDIPIVGGGV